MSQTYADERYARGGQDETKAGGIILMGTSFLAGLLVLLGLIYWTGAGPRHQAAMIAAGCEPSLFISGLPCVTRQMVISQYEGIVNPAAKELDNDIAAYQVSEGANLVSAEAALTAEVATEQSVDNSLTAATDTPQNSARSLALLTQAASNGQSVPTAAIIFTPQITVAVNALIKADQTLATLTAKQARSTTLSQLRSFNHRVQVANTAVQTKLKLAHEAVEAPLPAA